MPSDKKDPMELPPDRGQPTPPHLGLWDAVSIIIGIVVGATLYRAPPLIMSNVPGPWIGLGVWALGGALSLVGALCYAELASTYPRLGGEYVYLTRAYGPWVGALFGWAQLVVIRTASIGAMAFVFAEYAVRLWDFGAPALFVYAALAVAALSVLNVLGAVLGKWAQNLLTFTKLLGLGGILVAGLVWARPSPMAVERDVPGASLGLAMILVLYAYGGWNDAAVVAAELRDRRNISRALILGTAAVTLIYLAVNLAYLLGLGFEGVRQSDAVAAAVLERPLGPWGSRAMSLLVMISALGAINGLIFTGARVYATLGADHRVFARLGRWHPRLGSPLWSLAVQALISLAMIAGVGTEAGRGAIDLLLTQVGLRPLPWQQYFGGFNTLVAAGAPVFWMFFLLTGISLFVLRWKDRGVERPFALGAPLFPLFPLIFCGMCGYMLYSAITYAGALTLVGVIPLVIGIPLYWISRRQEAAEAQPANEPPGG